ncbi:hypothetical protein H0H87_012958 [Tephrocybe sp. NHM501043]|nr:hypothetical protein H0H87_012958 [Tephrocybe sp. NHM501043]
MEDEQPPPPPAIQDDEDAQSSEDEDGGLDWTKLPGIARPVIPKRGEKEFEPKAGGGSGLQIHVLESARSAMFDTLRATRTISSKAVSYAIWYPSLGRSHVTLAKGIHFSAMGHSAPRPIVDGKGVEKVHKRLELLPEEAIYLVERGSLFCWKYSDVDLSKTSLEMGGAPMSVQQVYAEMLGVYTYLKRLGYAVTRTKPPTSYYPTPPPWPSQISHNDKPTPSLWQRILSLFHCCASKFAAPFNWWQPLRISRWLHHDKNYASIFHSLRFMSSGHKLPLHHPDPEKRLEAKKNSPYQIFYNLYKPSTPFKPSAPPLPDFQIVVVNARTTPMPSLQELTDLFEVLPELPPPLPKIRRPLPGPTPVGPQSTTAPLTVASTPSSPTHVSSPRPSPLVQDPKTSFIQRLFPWAFPSKLTPGSVRRPHPFMALKAGKKVIVIAVVDAGNISFFRFGQGEFTEWPMA